MSDWDNAPAASGNDWETPATEAEASVAAGSDTGEPGEAVKVFEPARIIIPVEGPVVGQWNEREAFDYATYTAERDPEAPRGQPTGQWAASGRRYEWKEEFGDVAPRDEALERMLFGDPGEETENMGIGIQFDKFAHNIPHTIIFCYYKC